MLLRTGLVGAPRKADPGRIAATALALSFAGLALAGPGASPSRRPTTTAWPATAKPTPSAATAARSRVLAGSSRRSVHGQAGLACVDCHADLATATDFPHAEKLAPVHCATCHEAAAADYATSVHAEARRSDGAEPGGHLRATATARTTSAAEGPDSRPIT